MDTSAEFTSLVAAHHRLMVKYGRGGRWNANTSSHRVSNVQEGLIGEHVIADGAPWIQPSLTTQRPVTHRAMDVLETTCCPRCHLRIGTKPFEVMSLPESYAGSDCGDKMQTPGLCSSGATGGSGSIYLQLASMEYARLLAALNVGNRTLSTLIPDTLAAVQPYTTHTEGYAGQMSVLQTKRKPSESDADVQQTIAVKRTRLVWTDELHQRFVEAIERIGIDKAVPKAILEVMDIDGLTRENVASHLQKYRKKIRQASASKERTRFPESEEITVERSATTHGSNDFAEIDSTASATNNTGYSVTTAMPDKN